LHRAWSPHHAFDSFEGLSAPSALDGHYWRAGDLALPERQAREALEPLGASVYRGWIPEVFRQAEIDGLCLVHIEVDLYEPTRDSLEYFYPLLSPGGVLICDEYGFKTCRGARRALDVFIAGRPETVVEAPTGQAFTFKR
jgi:O-methyltransferase